MIVIVFKKRGLMGWEKKRYGEVLKRLIPEIRRFNKVIGNDVRTEIEIRFK